MRRKKYKVDWINFFVLDIVVEISTKNFSFATAIAALKASDQRDLVEIKKTYQLRALIYQGPGPFVRLYQYEDDI